MHCTNSLKTASTTVFDNPLMGTHPSKIQREMEALDKDSLNMAKRFTSMMMMIISSVIEFLHLRSDFACSCNNNKSPFWIAI